MEDVTKYAQKTGTAYFINSAPALVNMTDVVSPGPRKGQFCIFPRLLGNRDSDMFHILHMQIYTCRNCLKVLAYKLYKLKHPHYIRRDFKNKTYNT